MMNHNESVKWPVRLSAQKTLLQAFGCLTDFIYNVVDPSYNSHWLKIGN